MSDIYQLIESLERLLSEAWQVPLSTYVVINEDECLSLVDQMRTAIPREIREGERIQQERGRIVAQAEEEAERIVRLAHEEAGKVAERHDIVQIAHQRADTIIERAQRQAEVLKGEADEYARGVLLSLDRQLGALDGQIETLLVTVRNGLETLSGPREAEREEEAATPTQ
jgi:cell division septum initiation protein DivIVA